MKPGIHAIAPEDYHRDPSEQPSLSAHIAHRLLTQSPLHAWTNHPRLNPEYRPTRADKFDLGTAVHDLWLRGIDNVAVVDAADWRTKIAQEAKAEARAAGQIPLLAKDWDRVREMTDALREQLDKRDDDPPLFAPGKPEQTVIWEDRGVVCRSLVDWLHDDLGCIDDLKTTVASANPFAWQRVMFGIGGDIQARFNQRGIKAVTGREPIFRFVVVEAHPPYALSVVSLGPAAVAFADARVDQALDTWKGCLQTGIWPAYAPVTHYVDPPGWREQEWAEQQAIEEAA